MSKTLSHAIPTLSVLVRARRPRRAVLLLILIPGTARTALVVRAARTTEENSMSTVLTTEALQSRSDIELQTLMRNAQYDLACSLKGSEESRDALAMIDNITRVMRQRALRPRPPSF